MLIYSYSRHQQTYRMIMVLGLLSAALLGAAFGFQYFGGLAPCKLCLWQRWPHALIIFIALSGMIALRPRLVFALTALAALGNAGLAGYHSGVELGLFAGPASCSGSTDAQLSGAQMLDILMQTAVVRCDEVVWSFLGLSMAAWNGIFSLAQGGLAIWQLRQ